MSGPKRGIVMIDPRWFTCEGIDRLAAVLIEAEHREHAVRVVAIHVENERHDPEWIHGILQPSHPTVHLTVCSRCDAKLSRDPVTGWWVESASGSDVCPNVDPRPGYRRGHQPVVRLSSS